MAELDEIIVEREYCIIHDDVHTVEVPIQLRTLGVEHDEKTNRIYFKSPRYVSGTKIDLRERAIQINYMNAKGEKDAYIIDDLEYTDDEVTFSWLLSRKATAYKGIIRFVVCVTYADEKGVVVDEWNTALNEQFFVKEGLECTAEIPEETEDIIASLLSAMRTSANIASDNAEIARIYAENAEESATKAEEFAQGVSEYAEESKMYSEISTEASKQAESSAKLANKYKLDVEALKAEVKSDKDKADEYMREAKNSANIATQSSVYARDAERQAYASELKAEKYKDEAKEWASKNHTGEDISFDNKGTSLGSTNVQDAIVEIALGGVEGEGDMKKELFATIDPAHGYVDKAKVADVATSIPANTIGLSNFKNDTDFATVSQIPTTTSQLTNTSNYVSDPLYVHTDNNYSRTDKLEVAKIKDKQDKISQGENVTISDTNVISVKNASTTDKGVVRPDNKTLGFDGSGNLAVIKAYGDGDMKASVFATQDPTNGYVDKAKVADVANNVPTALSQLENDTDFITEDDISDKYVEKEEGKGLSTNDYTQTDKLAVLSISTKGDMYKSTYDTNADGKVDSADKADAVGDADTSVLEKLGESEEGNLIYNGKEIIADVPIATVDNAGKVKPDGTTITIKEDGTISSTATDDSIQTVTLEELNNIPLEEKKGKTYIVIDDNDDPHKATVDLYGYVKITTADNVTTTDGIALAGTEKNENVEGSLASKIKSVKDDLGDISSLTTPATNIVNAVNGLNTDLASVTAKLSDSTDYLKSRNLFNIPNGIQADDIEITRKEDGTFIFKCGSNAEYIGEITNEGSSWNVSKGFLIDVSEMSTVVISTTNDFLNRILITRYDANKVSLGFEDVARRSPIDVSNCHYITIRVGSWSNLKNTTVESGIQVEEGSTATPFQAYSKSNVELQLIVEELSTNKLDKNNPHITGTLYSDSLTTNNKQIANGLNKTLYVGNPELGDIIFQHGNKNTQIGDLQRKIVRTQKEITVRVVKKTSTPFPSMQETKEGYEPLMIQVTAGSYGDYVCINQSNTYKSGEATSSGYVGNWSDTDVTVALYQTVLWQKQ